mmetsp:Transcript_31013/g.42649  ORF Transcript_31013/g.42649 Transcript_31013/m.42649 type:complete len:117 (+) Transcript_31013:539-889(+)
MVLKDRKSAHELTDDNRPHSTVYVGIQKNENLDKGVVSRMTVLLLEGSCICFAARLAAIWSTPTRLDECFVVLLHMVDLQYIHDDSLQLLLSHLLEESSANQMDHALLDSSFFDIE